MRRLKHLMPLSFMLALLLLAGCATSQVVCFRSPVKDGATPWSGKSFDNDSADFQFAIMSDRHGGSRPGVFKKAVGQVNLLQPEFVMSVGDLINGGTDDLTVLKREYDEFDEMVGGLDSRFFRVAGNHDISNPAMLKMYQERYGHPYYHFVYKNVLFLVLNTEDDRKKALGETQIAYMQDVLAKNKDVRWTFVFMHKPLFAAKNPDFQKSWAPIEKRLADRPHSVFAGHWHRYGKWERHGQSYIHLATTGGGSGLAGTTSGHFDHIVWITMTDKGPMIANLLLNGIHDENVTLGK